MKNVKRVFRVERFIVLVLIVICSFLVTPANATTPNPQQSLDKIDLGFWNTCRVDNADNIKCWGRDDYLLSSPPPNLGEVIQISTGGFHACALSALGTPTCWGANEEGQTSVPDHLGSVKLISAGAANTCVINMANRAQCWGESKWGLNKIPKSLGAITDLAVGDGEACAVQISGVLKCWGDISDEIPKNLGKVSRIKIGIVGSTKCSIAPNGTAKCWNYEGSLKLPSNLGPVRSIDSSISSEGSDDTYDTFCAVQESLNLMCWDTRNPNSTISIIGNPGFTEVAMSSGATCALQIDGRSACWGIAPWKFAMELDETGGQSGAFQPSPSEPTLTKTSEGIRITVTPLADTFPNEPIARTIVDAKTGTEYCRGTSLDWSGCVIQLDHTDKYFRVLSQSSNRFGSSPIISSKPLRYCGSGATRIETVPSNATPVSGETVVLTGNVLDSCETANQVLVRQRSIGKTWSSWKAYNLTNNQFQLSKKVVTGTEFQFKTLVGGKIDAQGEGQILPSYSDVGLVVSGKSTKNRQGFNQGGTLTYNIYAPSFYNARCTMLAETEYAFNFALTHMGSETKYGYFNVKNGRGSGTLKMTWNGEARARVLCESPAFSNSVTAERYVIFRANF